VKVYKFSCGNSSTGVCGFVVEVRAESAEHALELARDYIREVEDGVPIGDEECGSKPGIVYANMYFSAGEISLADIEDEYEEE